MNPCRDRRIGAWTPLPQGRFGPEGPPTDDLTAAAVHLDGAVAVTGPTIKAVGPAAALAARYQAQRVMDATGRLVVPGLINTHTHLLQTFSKGLGEGLTLYDWVNAVTGPSVPQTLAAPTQWPMNSPVGSRRSW